MRVRKGDRLGHFLFGGSDFVMVFQAGVTLTPDSLRSESGHGYSHVLAGQRLGALRRVPCGNPSILAVPSSAVVGACRPVRNPAPRPR